MSTQTVNHANGLAIEEILPQAKLMGASSVRFSSCCGQWEECQPGDLYVAIVGADNDGHDDCPQAIENGAIAVVTERLLATRVPQIIVEDSRQAYGQICHALAGRPSERLTTIGVSGTDGKTVTSHLIKSILQVAGCEAGHSTSMGIGTGRNCPSLPRNEFNPPVFAEHLAQMAINDCSHAVVEVSCRDLAKRNFAGATTDVAVLTNMRQNDMEFHGTGANHRRSQLRLLDTLKKTGVVILNVDDPTSHFLVENCQHPALTIGMKHDANIQGRLLERVKQEQSFMITAGSESIAVRTAMIGDAHIYNCLSAAAVGLTLGVPLDVIAKGLELGSNIPGRMDRVECGQDFGVWIDAARTPNQLAAAVRTVKQVVKGKVWCVCSMASEQSHALRKRIGEVLDRAADCVVATLDSVDPMIDYEPMHQLLDGFEEPHGVQLIPNRFRAIEWVLSNAGPSDAVIISGCGEKPFALIGEHHCTIADRDVCEAWLYDHASIDETPSQNIYRIDDYR